MSYATSIVNDLAPYRKNVRSRIYPPTSSAPRRKTTPTSKLIKQAVDCLVRKAKLQPPNANFMTRLNATVRTRFKVAATLRKNFRAYRVEKEAPSLQNQAVSVAPAAEEQHVTILAAVVASRRRKTVSLWMSESPVWLIRHQMNQTDGIANSATPRLDRCARRVPEELIG